MLGYDKPLDLMASDHRGSFEHDLFGATEPVSNEVRDIIDARRGAKSAAGASSSAAGDRASR